MRPAFFDPLIARYVRERLALECRERGVSIGIARVTGLARSTISDILGGSRNVSDEFAAAMCKYWGLKQTELLHLAHETYGSRAPIESAPKTHPDLDITLEFCRTIYPKACLAEFETAARREPDRDRLLWFHQLHLHFREWLSRQAATVQRQHWHLLGMPLTPIEGAPRMVQDPPATKPRRPRKKGDQR